ncbi:MAG: cytochrome c [Myxococcaceae bacterium]
MKRLLLPSLLLAVLVGDARAQAPAPATDKVLPLPPDVVPSDGRTVVQRRMNRHGASLMELTLAVTLLQRDTIARAAAEIGTDTGLPVMPQGPAETPTQRNFRYLEAVLRERTATLAQASKNGDNASLATAFGNMMQVCISCHSLYLHQPDKAAPKP